MPSHDHIPKRRSAGRMSEARLARARASALRIVADKKRNRKRPKDDGGESVPVEPNRPNNLTGGAAAALEFDE